MCHHADTTDQSPQEVNQMMPKREYAQGERLSVVGFGGILAANEPPERVCEMVSHALDKGVNYFDVAPTYGNAEDLLGPVLHEVRDEIFLACKTTQRRKQDAARELRSSLARLEADTFDLYQLHGISSVADAETALSSGGAIDALVEARKSGLVRYLGFSAHSVKAALLAIEKFDFDSVLFPVNFVLYERENFGPHVVQKARERGMAVLALKALAKTMWPVGADRAPYPKCWYQPLSDPRSMELALKFTLAQPVTSAIPPGAVGLYPTILEIASRLTPLSSGEYQELRSIAQDQIPIFRLDT